MTMFCSLSGETPQEPVVSVRSGLLYEKRLIEKHLADAGVDPITGEQTSQEDLIEIRTKPTFIKPRTPAASSIPALLLTLQNEWDALMLETHQLRQQLHQTRTELTTALYETEAAKRVIARLISERDDARSQLASFRATVAAHNNTVEPSKSQPSEPKEDSSENMAVDEEEVVLPAEVVETIDSTCAALSTVRRGRKPPPTLATPDDISNYKVQTEIKTLHTAKQPASLSLDAFEDKYADEYVFWILSAGKDGSVHIVDGNDAGAALASVKAHDGAVNSAVWIRRIDASDEPILFVTGGADKTVKIWTFDPSAGARSRIKNKHSIETHDDQVTCVSVHPSGKFVLSAGLDSVWAFSEIDSGNVLYTVRGDSDVRGYTSIQVHPDGVILATGSNDALVRVWDLKTHTNVHTFNGHSGPISSIAFSENGYHLATSSTTENVVKFWDLRKLTNFYNLELEPSQNSNDSSDTMHGVSRIKFDMSGQYIGVLIGTQLRIHLVKKWSQVGVWDADWESELTDLVMGKDVKWIVVGELSRKVVVIGQI